MTKQLRPYQKNALEDVSRHFREGTKRVMLCFPTGSGKTRCGAAAVDRALQNGRSVLWLAHRGELVDQAAETLRETTGKRVGIFQGSRKADPSAPIQVASIQTMIRRDNVPKASFVVVDEAHRFLAEQWNELLTRYHGAHFLYLTATPSRGDGKPMGDIADVIVSTVQPRELMAEGVLTPCEIIAPNEQISKGLSEDPTDAYLRWGGNRRAVIFCQTKEHARRTSEKLSEKGVSNGVVTDDTPWNLRKSIYKDVRSGKVRVLVNVFVATEGLDIPELEVCIIARTMGHASMFIQAGGRVLRAAKGKESALLIDLKGVVNKYGTLDADRHYFLEGDEAIQMESNDAVKKQLKCSECGSLRSGPICPVCSMAHTQERPLVPEIVPTHMEMKNAVDRSDESAEFYIRTIHRMLNERVKNFAREASTIFKAERGSYPLSTWIDMYLQFIRGTLPPSRRPAWWPKDVDMPHLYRVPSTSVLQAAE